MVERTELIMKKLMCVFLVLILLFPCTAALADTQYYDYSGMSTTQLQKAAVNASTDAEATAIFKSCLAERAILPHWTVAL